MAPIGDLGGSQNFEETRIWKEEKVIVSKYTLYTKYSCS